MIPTQVQAKELWEKYSLPKRKQIHVTLVSRAALYFAKHISESLLVSINIPLLESAALLHDIDNAVLRLPGEKHPDTAVRILRAEGLEEVADIVATHSVHAILDPAISPKTWEEKILFLSDKMVKFEIMTVDRRFALWRNEHLPEEASHTLDMCYPMVKQLESELCSIIHIVPEDVAKVV